jgi:catechol 2,3-dioxygenase-like lactoylglutathione lyase family enzyme
MVWSSSAQGIRPYAPSTRQTVCKLVTPTPENSIFCPLCFQSLTHSFAGVFSTTPLQSYSSALFAQNTGGGYTLQDLLFIFKGLRTLAPNGQREGVTRLAPRSLFEGSRLYEGLHRKSLLCALRALCGEFLFCVAFPCHFLPSMTRWGRCGHKILESTDEGELGYASLESKSEIPGKIMIDHVILTVSDFKRSVAFYAKALKPLGITTFMDYQGKDGHPDLKGFGDGKRYFFWLKEGKPDPQAVHVGFVAKDHSEVDAFYKAALAAGGKSKESPRARLEYYPGYYAAWVLDPDGHDIEVVNKS